MSITSSTGGTIVNTQTGFFHYENTEKFVSQYEVVGEKTDNGDFKCDWHPYFVPEVKITGNVPSRVITFKK